MRYYILNNPLFTCSFQGNDDYHCKFLQLGTAEERNWCLQYEVPTLGDYAIPGLKLENKCNHNKDDNDIKIEDNIIMIIDNHLTLIGCVP